MKPNLLKIAILLTDRPISSIPTFDTLAEYIDVSQRLNDKDTVVVKGKTYNKLKFFEKIIDDWTLNTPRDVPVKVIDVKFTDEGGRLRMKYVNDELEADFTWDDDIYDWMHPILTHIPSPDDKDYWNKGIMPKKSKTP